MTTFYFIRHGQADYTEANTKIYQGHGLNLIPLSETGREQIAAAAGDPRLKRAQLILSSPFGRTLHTAAILSGKLGLDVRVETDLHEWMADSVHFAWIPQEEADRRWRELEACHGVPPEGETPPWETASQMKRRVFAVLERYSAYRCVIVCCHGILMQYVLGIPHPSNGQIEELQFDAEACGPSVRNGTDPTTA